MLCILLGFSRIEQGLHSVVNRYGDAVDFTGIIIIGVILVLLAWIPLDRMGKTLTRNSEPRLLSKSKRNEP